MSAPAHGPVSETQRLATRIDGPVVLIGDVHGQVDLLDRLMDRLARREDFRDRWVGFLGDLVDRGPDPRGAIDRVLELMAAPLHLSTVF